MNRTKQIILRIALLWLSCGLASAGWPPEGAISGLGLPSTTEGGVEIRVWLGGGVARPYFLYRVRETPDGPIGEKYAWVEVTHPHPDRFSEKAASKENKQWRRFLKKHYCEPITTDDYIWCRVPGDSGELWSVMLHDLMPDKLWDLPQEIERDCEWMRADGQIVGIEILDDKRRHSVSYANPDFCCADVACAVANHVRTIVKRID